MNAKYLLMVPVMAAVALGALSLTSAVAAAPSSAPAAQEGPNGDGPETEGPDQLITGSALKKASAAALAYLGEGRVTGTEVGDEEGFYEVEVTLPSDREVDVHLDESFNVLGTEAD